MRIIVHSPYRTATVRESVLGSNLFFLCNNLFHYFRRSRSDGVQANVAPSPADGIFGGVAEPAEQLHAIVGDFLREFGRVELGHSDLAHALLAAIHQIERAIGKPFAGFNVGEVLREAMAPNLVMPDGLAEGCSLGAIIQRIAHR